MLRFLFPFNLFLGAFLLFSIQPMAAKVLLPLYGGAPGIWIVCMLFFQGILLLAYGYVSIFPLVKTVKLWFLIHLGLICLSLVAMPALFQPVALSPHPEQNILYNLFIQLGLPLLLVGASAPLLQFLYSRSRNKDAIDPYFLYSASNLGSLIALLSYPWLIEQFINLDTQFHLWRFLYFVYTLGLLGLFFGFTYQPVAVHKAEKKACPWAAMRSWFCLSFIPCSLMLGVSLYITTDISATPLFWVLPLALYLLSFILSFSHQPLISPNWIKRNILFAAAFVIFSFILGNKQIALQSIVFNLAGFFMIALACHTELYQRRPAPQDLILFYFCLALGGVSAGLINALIAPRLFNQVFEYPIAMLLSFFVLPIQQLKARLWTSPFIIVLLISSYFMPDFTIKVLSPFELIALIATLITFLAYKNKTDFIIAMTFILSFTFLPKNEWRVLVQERNFYGVKRVVEKENLHVLMNQSTIHGVQYMDKQSSFSMGSSYYTPVKQVVNLMHQDKKSLTATTVGLGTGTTLCQYRAQDQLTMIEIDPQVIDIAQNPALFTYMRDCLGQAKLINEDGRMAINKLADASQDLIVLDAFSSDAIPIHLMTLEAFTQYKQKLKANGVILINVSNRYLNLLPVLNAIARSLNMMIFYNIHEGNAQEQQFDSQWVLLSENEALVPSLNKLGWHFLAHAKQLLWTDNYSNIIPILQWY